MANTLDKLKITELTEIYEKLLIKLNDYKPDTQDYIIVEEKLHNIEEIIQQKKPSYFVQREQKEDIAFINNMLADNYDIEQVCIMFNVSRQTIYNWAKHKKIKIIKIGRKPYVPKSEVEKIMKDGTDDNV